MGYPNADSVRRELITMTPLGPKLRIDGHPAADDMRSKLSQCCKKVGKLLVPRTAEQIAEYDGEGGMPMWIVIGTTVYDITSKFLSMMFNFLPGSVRVVSAPSSRFWSVQVS